MKYIRIISWFLGISMFGFGFLKFFNPFKSWYTVQIAASGLGEFSYVSGILGELAVGLSFMLALLLKNKLSARQFTLTISAASLVLMVMMATGIWVHLHPAVPADVLPLKIKPPYIPGAFFLLGLLNLLLMMKVAVNLANIGMGRLNVHNH